MNRIRAKAAENRSFLPKDLILLTWGDIEPYVTELQEASLDTEDDLHSWLKKRSELDAVIEEDKAWLYIRQSCHTDNPEYASAFGKFLSEVEEPYAIAGNQLDKKLLAYCSHSPYPDKYEIFLRNMRMQTEIFRTENVSIQARLEAEEQQYGTLTGAMTVTLDGKELTLQGAQNYLKSTDRSVRKKAFELIWNRRSADYEKLNLLLTSLLEKRQEMAKNAGFDNYLDYRFVQLGRFDYSREDCLTFHESVKQHIVPVMNEIHAHRKEQLGLSTLQPYDLDVDPENKPALVPFSNVSELVGKTLACFREIDPEFEGFIRLMHENGYLDLDSRKGKAPGGYNYPLHESNVPFIFMNATHNLRDMETMMHEGGHAIHSFLSKDLDLVYYKDTPAEIAEVASMAMELISMEHWQAFLPNREELHRARISQLEGVLAVLPWVATVDKFQHWLYTNPASAVEDRLNAWQGIEQEFGGNGIDWSAYPNHHRHLWQKQIHIFQFPLYYIEYGIAQLGAIGIWKNYKSRPQETLQAYRKALSMGYSATLPELYEAAGIRFDFSASYIRELSEFVRKELDTLRQGL
ncbi:MAG: M3 family oligoendopeptidase [Bacteroidales bacterium]|nr:M3 family oligoendopeptidase [Bacteroidales bacterium]